MTEQVIHPDFPHLALGRRLEPDHDPQSRRFLSRFAEAPLRSRTHRRYGPVLDQGSVGACTGHAAAHAMNSGPLRFKGSPAFNGREACQFYAEATAIDPFPGQWFFDKIGENGPEGHGQDTGSSGLAVAQALRTRGLVTRYEHAFGLDQALRTLTEWPVITGVAWYEGMFTPDEHGYVEPRGEVAGGHEFCVRGIDVKRRDVLCVNSWGHSWGVKGHFRMTWDVWGRLLGEDGDVTLLFREV